jgi:hypothetical protein
LVGAATRILESNGDWGDQHQPNEAHAHKSGDETKRNERKREGYHDTPCGGGDSPWPTLVERGGTRNVANTEKTIASTLDLSKLSWRRQEKRQENRSVSQNDHG